jgi:predicted DNA-binding transcriptional regulator YafY
MADDSTTSRILRLLTLLQSHQFWLGRDLAERLGVSSRTLRRDIDRLRDLDYRVNAVRGASGGYQLESGSELPPMIFSSDEAVALALALQAAVSTTSIAGIGDITIAAFAKLEQVLPARLRSRVSALQATAVSTAPITTESLVDADALAVLALACRDSEALRLGYTAGDGTTTRRRVEPHRLVQHGRRWYLVCWEIERADWRTFRVDRIAAITHTARRVTPRVLPDGMDATTYVARATSGATPASFSATIRIAAPHTHAVAYLGDYTTGLEPDGDDHTRWLIRSDRLEILAGALTWLPWDFELQEGAELRGFLRGFSSRLSEAICQAALPGHADPGL